MQKPEQVSSKTPGTVREEDKILETEIRAPMAMEVLRKRGRAVQMAGMREMSERR